MPRHLQLAAAVQRARLAAGHVLAACGLSTRAAPPSCILPAHSQPLPSICTGQPYPPEVWQQLASHTGPGASVVAVSPEVCGAPSAAAQLSAAGFNVINALVLRERSPAGELHGSGRRCCLAVEGACGPAAAPAREGQPSAVDALVLADLLHLTDTRRALQAARRHLKERGVLMAVWTNRDLASAFVQELEELLEGAVPGWSRYDGQHGAVDWVPRLQTGNMFRLIDFSAFPHTLRLPLGAFLDELLSKGALHAALGSSRRRAFHADVRRLAERHFGPAAAAATAGQQEGQQGQPGESAAAGQHPQQRQQGQGRHDQHGSNASQRKGLVVELPLLTKAYILCKCTQAPQPASRRSSWPAGGGSPLELEHVCLFCGSPIEDEA